jgi:hypothetical protein
MQETALASRRPEAILFVTDHVVRVVYADYRNADWVTTALFELGNLIPEISHYAVDLFDHRLCEDLYLDSNLDRGDRPSANQVALIRSCCFSRNDFTEGPVPTPSLNSVTFVLTIKNAILAVYGCVYQLRGSIDGYEVFE